MTFSFSAFASQEVDVQYEHVIYSEKSNTVLFNEPVLIIQYADLKENLVTFSKNISDVSKAILSEISLERCRGQPRLL